MRCRTGRGMLADRFIQHDPDARSEIEASNIRVLHGYFQASIVIRQKHAARKTARLGPEYNTVVFFVIKISVQPVRLGRKKKKSGRPKRLLERFKIDVSMEFDMLPVVKPRSLQRTVVHSKSRHSDDMKW